MTLAMWISTVILALWPLLFAGSFWFFELPKRQRQALAQFVPMAARGVRNQPISHEAKVQLGVVFVVKAFRAARLPHYPDELVRAAIEAELQP